MGAGHATATGLYVEVDSPVHRLAPAPKIAAALVTVLAVVATPRTAVWAFGAQLAVIAAVAAAARIPGRVVRHRARIELPFLAFALFLPIVGTPPHVQVAGLSLSEPGLWAAWNIVAKGTLGVLVAIVLTATTTVTALLAGLERLRVPGLLVAITGFMVRYLDVILGEAARMRTARLSRGDDPRWLWQGRAIAATAGTLFIRSYERGERVHLAMQARGYQGTMPALGAAPSAPPAAWAVLPPVAVVLVALTALARQ